jgi:sRNA-binding protein
MEQTMLANRDDLDRGVEILCEVYPAAFTLEGRNRRPLKKDIAEDIKADLVADPQSELRFVDVDVVIDWYCGHVGYHVNSSIAGANRYDRHGNIVGKITPSEAAEEKELAADGFARIQASREISNFRKAVEPVPAVPVVAGLMADTTMTDEELVGSIERHLGSLRTLMSLPDDIRRISARPVVLLLIDELKTLDARITKGAGE